MFSSHLRDNISMYVRQELVESSLLGSLAEFLSTNKTLTTDYRIPLYTMFLSHLFLTCICSTSPDSVPMISTWPVHFFRDFYTCCPVQNLTSPRQFHVKEWWHFNHFFFFTCISLMSPWCCAWWYPGPTHLSCDDRNLYRPTSEWPALKVNRLNCSHDKVLIHII